jgi:hypothetical protein
MFFYSSSHYCTISSDCPFTDNNTTSIRVSVGWGGGGGGANPTRKIGRSSYHDNPNLPDSARQFDLGLRLVRLDCAPFFFFFSPIRQTGTAGILLEFSLWHCKKLQYHFCPTELQMTLHITGKTFLMSATSQPKYSERSPMSWYFKENMFLN